MRASGNRCVKAQTFVPSVGRGHLRDPVFSEVEWRGDRQCSGLQSLPHVTKEMLRRWANETRRRRPVYPQRRWLELPILYHLPRAQRFVFYLIFTATMKRGGCWLHHIHDRNKITKGEVTYSRSHLYQWTKPNSDTNFKFQIHSLSCLPWCLKSIDPYLILVFYFLIYFKGEEAGFSVTISI